MFCPILSLVYTELQWKQTTHLHLHCRGWSWLGRFPTDGNSRANIGCPVFMLTSSSRLNWNEVPTRADGQISVSEWLELKCKYLMEYANPSPPHTLLAPSLRPTKISRTAQYSMLPPCKIIWLKERNFIRKVAVGHNSINIDCVQIIYILASWN